MTVADAHKALVDVGVELMVAVPDSLLAPLCRYTASRGEITYIQVSDEATAAAIAAGARLAGARSLLVMENSGLRRACETLARQTLSHRLHTAMLLSRRGAFGEGNWWGLPHEETMYPHLDMYAIVKAEVDSPGQFPASLRKAFATLDTGQRSVSLIANAGFTSTLRNSS